MPVLCQVKYQDYRILVISPPRLCLLKFVPGLSNIGSIPPSESLNYYQDYHMFLPPQVLWTSTSETGARVSPASSTLT